LPMGKRGGRTKGVAIPSKQEEKEAFPAAFIGEKV